MMTELKIGYFAPFNVPEREGCMMGIGYPLSGLNVMCHYPDLSEKELEIFNMPLIAYSYQETGTVVPIAWWVFSEASPIFCTTNGGRLNPFFMWQFEKNPCHISLPGMRMLLLDDEE